jgi:chemotaxis protein methyltransferase CheR
MALDTWDIAAQAGQTPALMPISDKEFDRMRQLIYEKFGINLSDEKKSLLVGRLQKILRSEGFQSFDQYYDNLLTEKSGKAISKLIDHISTNHTYFNREKAHFDYFRNHALPEVIGRLKKKNINDLRIWCAGCSSGEEAYTLLMLMRETLGEEYRTFDAGLLATDISDRILNVARQGVYPDDRIEALPDPLKRKYFVRQGPEHVQVVEDIRREAVFRRFNLMNSRFPFKKQFHIIFCRNVMIYFDRQTRDSLVRRFHAATEAGGYLFIGHSETLGREQPLYEYLIPAAYRKR